MSDKNRCTECDGFNTERVHTEWFTDMMEEIRICNDCPTQYTNKYNIFDKETDFKDE